VLEREVPPLAAVEHGPQQRLRLVQAVEGAMRLGEPDRRRRLEPRLTEPSRELEAATERRRRRVVVAQEPRRVADVAVEPAPLPVVRAREGRFRGRGGALDGLAVAGDLAQAGVPLRQPVEIGELGQSADRPMRQPAP
jgi:hypothetical protein